MPNLIKGHLKFLVLNELNSQPKTGYELMKDLEEYSGKRPSPGSMYPLLESSLEKKLISVKQEGKRKVYSILIRGKRRLNELKAEKEGQIRNHLEILKSAGEEIPIQLKDFDNNKELILKNMGVFMEFKHAIFKVNQKGLKKHEKAVRKILREAISKLEKLR